jgi:hypothetical protein
MAWVNNKRKNETWKQKRKYIQETKQDMNQYFKNIQNVQNVQNV